MWTMYRKIATAMLVCGLFTTVPLSAAANEQTTIQLESRVTVDSFLQMALTELTYQHESKSMRQEILDDWVKLGELEDEKAYVTQDQVARVLVRALGQQDLSTLVGYKKQANSLGLFKGIEKNKRLTVTDVHIIFGNYEAIKNKDITNKGVKEVSVEDFMRNPGNFGYQLSTDGNYISFASEWESRSNVFVKDMNSDADPVRVTSSKDRDIAGSFWKDDYVLYLKDNAGDENYHIYSSTFNGKEEKDLTPYENVVAYPVDHLNGVQDEILIMMNKDDATVFDVYKLNVKTGDTTLVAKNPGMIQGWLADSDGQIRMAIESDGVVGTILYRSSEDEPFESFISLEAGDTVTPIAFSKDNQSIYAISNKNRDKAALVKYDLQANEELILDNVDVDISGALYSRSKDKLLYSAYITDKVHYEFLDEEFEIIFHKIRNKLGVEESDFGINDYNKEMTKFIVSISSDKVYGKYYYYDATSDELTELAELGAWLNPDELSTMHSISYEARDGLTINGYLTLPVNKVTENLPMIVIPHGGPWARDIWGFNPEAQLLANRGYAVLQVNFRSSTGYGRAFLEAGNKQWGLAIQDDITDGVEWAIDQGIADPERIGIYGASFGGYATLVGITHTPDLYAAAVDYVGVSNIFTLLETIPPYWESNRNMFYERVGHPEKDKELLTAASPVFHVDKIKTPLFVAQGANDPRVNQAESDQIVDALKGRGIEVEYMLKENEGHGFANEENRIEFYNAMMSFFDKYLK